MSVRSRHYALLALALLGAGCSSPTPSHLTRLWPNGTTGTPIIGTSTEDGVLLVAQPQFQVGDMFEIQFPVGNSVVRDYGRIDRMNNNLAVVRPITARLAEGRIATELHRPGEQVYLALRDDRDGPRMEPVDLWMEGAFGDWVVLPEGDPALTAHDYRGTALYVDRDGRWQIIGVLAGLTARDEADPGGATALGFIGLLEMSRILPDLVPYFERDVRPLRPDFEFGVPLQPGDIQLEPTTVEDAFTAPATAPAPAPATAPATAPPPTPKGDKPKPAPGGGKPKPAPGGGKPRSGA